MEVQGFPGLAGYYRRFVKDFSTIALPLTKLSRKVPFVWSSECEQSFQQLKYLLTHAPVLTFPNDGGNFEIYSDVSLNGLGCVLMQHDKVIVCVSWQLKPHEKNYPTHNLELPNLNPRQRRLVELLSDYDCTIEYHPGHANSVANALSMKSHGQLNALYASCVPLLTNLRSTKVALKEGCRGALIASFQAVLDGKKKDLWIRDLDDMLMQGKHMYVPNVEELKRDILDEAYISAYAMHPGSTKMLRQRGKSRLDCYNHSRYLSGNGKILQWISCTNYLVRKVVTMLERTIQTLADMLTLPVLQFGDAWHKRLPLIVFAYNNCFHSSIGMAPFEALYGKPCRTPLCWFEVDERVLVGTEIVDETAQNIQVIKGNLKVAQDRHKSIVDKHSTNRVYKVGDWVFLKLSPWKVLSDSERKGSSALGTSDRTRSLNESVSDPSHVIPPQPLEINPDLTYDEVPVTILDWKDKVLRNKTVRMVKVLWRNHSVEEATWEREERMRDMYPRLFYGFDGS
ncbi:uncharacterized protein [Malus domestica]|uniref:uncharacterized protein n=1 Tax=Malus domestica TaxID=3750 RepID=UPI003976F530